MIIIAVISMMLGACTMSNDGTKIADQQATRQAIESAIQTSNVGDQLILDDLVDFPWDRVCSFHEGDSSSFVNKQLGFEWDEGEDRIWNAQYLIFTNDQQVAMHLALDTKQLYLDIPDEQSCIVKAEATFRVESSGQTGEGAERRYLTRVK
jgi:hypothetical protein